jgi:transmembrane sensor
MSNLVRFPSRQRANEEAASWLVALDEGLSDAEYRDLEKWIEADPAHAEALLRLARAWDALDPLSELSEIFPLEQYGQPQRKTWHTWRAAAVLLVVVGVAGLVTYALVEPLRGTETASIATPADPSSAAGTDATDVESRTYRTAIGERLSTRLADGSEIMLNTDSQLDVEYSATERIVVLNRGEAIFRVARDPGRPFGVRVGERVVQAVGTVFNIKRNTQDDVEVTVTEGQVRVMHPAARVAGNQPTVVPELTLVAGDLAVLREFGDQVRRIESVQIEANLSWQHGTLVYRGETLVDVLADMGRYTTVQFRIADDSLRDRRVGGYFRAGDVDGLLLALRESFGIELHREGDVVVLTDGR